MKILRILFLGAAGVALAAVCIFFVYYTGRLIYINVFGPSLAGRRQNGMYIGAVAFPIAAMVFGWLSWKTFGIAAAAERKGRKRN
jgi:hypothetical protein